METLKNGKDLKAWRKRNGLSIVDLSEKTGYSSSRLKHIEADNANLTKRIKKALNAIDEEFHVKDDLVNKSWSDFISTGKYYSEYEIDTLSQIIPSVLNLEEIHNPKTKEDYLRFLDRIFTYVNKIKNGPVIKDLESFTKEYGDYIKEIKRSAFQFSKASTHNEQD